MKIKKRTKVWLAVSLALIFIASIGANLIQSNFGKTDVDTKVMSLAEIGSEIRANNEAYGKNVEISFTEDAVSEIQFKILVPENATVENPVPAIITCHGAYNNKEMQNINFVEWARRGFVVISIDGAGHGDSDASIQNHTHNSNGIEALAEYAMSLPFVDENQIGVTGHSWGNSGCTNAINVINLETSNHIAAFLQGQGSLYANNMIEEATEDLLWGFMVGKYDEMDVVWWNAYTITTSDWAKGWVKNIYDAFDEEAVPLGTWFDPDGAVTLDEGTRFDGSHARVLYNPPTTHPGAHFSISGCATYLNFFYGAFGVPSGAEYIPSSNQVWYIMVAFTLLGLLAWYSLAFPVIEILLATPLFDSIRRKEERVGALPSIKSGKEFIPLVIMVVLLAVFSGKSVVPLTAESARLFPQNAFLPLPTAQANGFILWSMVCGLVALIAIIVFYFIKRALYGKNEEGIPVNPFMCAKISGADMLKSFLFVFCLVGLMYVVIYLVEWIFQVDFRICAYQVMAFKLDRIPLILRYTFLYGFFYLVNAILVANTRYRDLSKWASTAIISFGNVIGIAVLLFVEYNHLLTKGVLLTATSGTTFIVLYSFLCPLILAPFYARFCEEKTNNIWVGASFNAVLFTSALVSTGQMVCDITFLGL